MEKKSKMLLLPYCTKQTIMTAKGLQLVDGHQETHVNILELRQTSDDFQF